MKKIISDYKKYRWFFTSSGKLVVGGKSAEQNDELLERIKETEKDFFVMHTSHPGSPFCAIISDKGEVSKKDLEECAVFTGCFSRAWKEGKKKTNVHVFSSMQLEKKKGMKTGTWHVAGKIKELSVGLELFLSKQKRTYRAVPKKTVMDKNGILISPGKVNKDKMAERLVLLLKEKEEKKNELMAALPAGGFKC